MTDPEPTIAEAQAALDDVRRTIATPLETVKSVAPMVGFPADYYDVHFVGGPAITVCWFRGRESFQEAVRAAIARQLGSGRSALLADHAP